MNGRSTRPGWDIGEGGPGGWSSRKVLIGIREEERLTNKLRTFGYMYAFIAKVVPKGLQSVDIGLSLD